MIVTILLMSLSSGIEGKLNKRSANQVHKNTNHYGHFNDETINHAIMARKSRNCLFGLFRLTKVQYTAIYQEKPKEPASKSQTIYNSVNLKN